MKFVRWLGAFGTGNSLTEAATWEKTQVSRQVAAEPLIKGKSHLSHAKIGLSVAHPDATFARGWLNDAYTVIEEKTGLIKATRERNHEFKNMDRFLAALNKRGGVGHAEAAFNTPVYDAVVVKGDASPRGKRRAQRLADFLKLPLKTI